MTTDNHLASEAQKIDRVVAVMTTIRAGSSLMSSLLDAHPNVATSPDCILMGLYEFWQIHNSRPKNELVESFMDYYAVLFDHKGQCKCRRVGPDFGDYLNLSNMGPNRDEPLYVDKEAFKINCLGALGDEHPISRKRFFQSVHLAYSKAWNHCVENPMVSFGLHIAHEDKVTEFLEDFPDAFFIQMVRHPINAMGSQLRMLRFRGEIQADTGVGIMAMARYMGSPVPAKNRSQWRAVRLEDLHHNSRETMEKLCSWLDLPWNDSLLFSTVNGKQWWNEKNSIQISGSSNAIPAQRFQQYIPWFDRFRLDVLFVPKLDAWGYPVNSIHRRWVIRIVILPLLLLPFKIELISIFRSNANSSWRRIINGVQAFYQGRKFLAAAWIRTFRDKRTEVDLL